MRDVDKGHAWLCFVGVLGTQFLNGAISYGSGVIHVALLDYFKEDVAKTAFVGSLFANILCILGMYEKTNIFIHRRSYITRQPVLRKYR